MGANLSKKPRIPRHNLSPFHNLVLNDNPDKVKKLLSSDCVTSNIVNQKSNGYNIIDLMIVYRSFGCFNDIIESEYMSEDLLYNCVHGKSTIKLLFESFYDLTENHGLKYDDIKSLVESDNIKKEYIIEGKKLKCLGIMGEENDQSLLFSELERLEEFKERVSSHYNTGRSITTSTLYERCKAGGCAKINGKLIGDIYCNQHDKINSTISELRNRINKNSPLLSLLYIIKDKQNINEELYKIIEAIYEKYGDDLGEDFVRYYEMARFNKFLNDNNDFNEEVEVVVVEQIEGDEKSTLTIPPNVPIAEIVD